MGCDIHAVVEWATDKRPDAWDYSRKSFVDLDRAYFIFSRLAGVRGDGPPVVPQRGLPPGFDCDDDLVGDHSFTWLTVDEWEHALILARGDSAREGYSFDGPNEYDAVTAYGRALEKAGYRVRIVFGFDS